MIPRRMSLKEWNDVWFDKVTPVKSQAKGFLMINQLMTGVVKFKGKHYRVTVWGKVGNNPALVETTEI